MHASVITFQRRPERLSEIAQQFHEKVGPTLLRQPGFEGIYILVDRQTGKQLSVMLWESDQAARAAMTVMDPIRHEREREMGDTASSVVEFFEVVVQPQTVRA